MPPPAAVPQEGTEEVVVAPTMRMVNCVAVPIPAGEAKAPDAAEEHSAACDLRNISKEEIQRRYVVAKVWALVSVAAAAAILRMEHGGADVSRAWRLLVSFPLGLAVGTHISAQEGMCGISTLGMWDPDGHGIRKAPKDIAKKLWSKAKRVHAKQIAVAWFLTGLFYLAPV